MKLHHYIEKVKDIELQGSHKEEEIALKLLSNKEHLDDEEDVHGTAKQEGIDKHKFEEAIYKLAQDIFSAGKFNESGMSEGEFDDNELEMGINVEMEHTRNPLIAKRIAMDHLSEREDYYSFGKKAGIFDELKGTNEAEIIPFPNPKAPIPEGISALIDPDTFQEFVNDVYDLMLGYEMKYNEQLNQLWFNELYGLNCKRKNK
jgi:hypothetical protein